MLRTSVGCVLLPSPVMTAAGVTGYGEQLLSDANYDELGAVVVKSLSVLPRIGNPEPRRHWIDADRHSLINNVGLEGPGIEVWRSLYLDELQRNSHRIVLSVWGGCYLDYERAATLVADMPKSIVAVEINISCPNTDDDGIMFAHSEIATRAVVEVMSGCGKPLWVKLSPNYHDIVAIAAAAAQGGAAAVVLTNTLQSMAINSETRKPVLGGQRGGLSGAALHPVALRAVFDVYSAMPELPIVGVGGVRTAEHAINMLLAGASAVQVGTAILANPYEPWQIISDMSEWCHQHDVTALSDIIGAAH